MTIIIIVNPFVSHFLALMDFADKMKANGYDVIFVGYKKTIDIAHQYEYQYIKIATSENEPNIKDRIVKSDFYDEIRSIISNYDKPHVLLPVSRFKLYFEAVYGTKANLLLYSLCCGADRINMVCPPNTSDYFPQKYGKKNLIVLAMWLRRYLRLEFHGFKIHKRSQIMSIFYYKRNYKKKTVYGIDGVYLDYPQLIFGPKIFNLYNSKANLFWGLGVSKKREKNEDALKKGEKKNIYCTFGTMSFRYPKLPSLIELIIKIADKHKDWNIIIQADEEMLKKFKSRNNITIVSHVNQLDLIRNFDIVICHGGFSTIKECIYYNTPIMVFPCSYDQHGNAARINYFKIGISSKVLSRSIIDRITNKQKIDLSAEKLENMINELLYNSEYKDNLRLLYNKIMNSDEKQEVLNFFKGLP